jgi:hypothetical protein
MNWVSKSPPIYVWSGDTWYNEIDKKTYLANISKNRWECEQMFVDFPKKTVVLEDICKQRGHKWMHIPLSDYVDCSRCGEVKK